LRCEEEKKVEKKILFCFLRCEEEKDPSFSIIKYRRQKTNNSV